MVYMSLLMIHICGAVVGLLSGFLSMAVRKGAGLHQVAGTIFFVSMLGMSGSGAFISAFIHPVRLNVVAGLLTFYLVTTAWRTARRRHAGTDAFDYAAFLLVLAVGLGAVIVGAREKPAAPFFVFGTIALLFAAADVRMFIRGGYTGRPRIARHLWRMCLALLIATLSFYPGQAKLFSKALRATNLLYVPHVLLIGSILWWIARMQSARRDARLAVGDSR
jgi:uncharacterized membrane protein